MSTHKMEWKPVSKLLIFCTTVLLVVLCSLKEPVTVRGRNLPGQCVQVFQQFNDYNLNSYQLDTRNDQFSKLNELALPITSFVSPDGKHAAFFQIIDNPPEWTDKKIGLFVAQPASSQAPVLLFIYTAQQLEGNDTIRHYLKWAPDSNSLAYIEPQNARYFVAIVDATGTNKRRFPVSIPDHQDRLAAAYLSTWSADSQYIAVIHELLPLDFENPDTDYLTVLSQNTLTATDVGLITANAPAYGRPDVAWAPRGHKVAMLVGLVDTTLIIWSP